jgi:hypothetical protein
VTTHPPKEFAVHDLLLRLQTRVVGADPERGDVPGWVLVTIMTAGLVTLLWGLAGDTLSGLFSEALGSVTGPGN